MRRRLIWQIYPTYLAIALAALLAVAWLVSHSLEEFHLRQAGLDLEARARLVEHQAAALLDPPDPLALQQLARALGERTATRITLILPGGEVLGDSREEPARMDNHLNRPEVMAAMAGEVGREIRYSNTLDRNMLYVALPVMAGGRLLGVVRTSVAATALDRTLRGLYLRIAGGGLLVALAVSLVSLGVSRRIARPLEEMRRGADRFAHGELGQPLPVTGAEEVAGLAEALNRMAGQLDDRLGTVVRQRNEQEAVLASMVEGVLAVDRGERILRLNGAAEQLLGVTSAEATGRPIQEAVRKTDLQRFVTRALESEDPVEADIVLRSAGEERFLQAHGTMLRDAQGEQIGALIVLNDVTRLRRLENMRKDFVANVSHELKTPITAIKGSVETLLDGALSDPESARRFLQIIARQGERLNLIIDDLLTLSRIEQEADRREIALQRTPLQEVLRAAVQACSVAAASRKVLIDLEVPEGLEVQVNPALLEQAVINLIDNAVKYSPADTRVRVEAEASGEGVSVRVRDQGCGIPREHLPRLFERFYRVDKARSRKAGGTGLGLAIVKHIVQAHGGRIEVESAPGEGSTFTILLPGG